MTTAESSRPDDADTILSPEEKLEQAYLHVTEAMSADGGETPPPQETVGITPPGSEEYERRIAEMKDQLLRNAAEMENVRRRAQKDVDEASRYAVAGFARDLVSVIENLYRAASAIPHEARDQNPMLKTLGDGVEMTLAEFTGVLARNGVTRIEPHGQPFDHNLHQAVSQIESADHEPGTVLHVMQAGYALKDRLLVPAMVGVARAPAAAQPAATANPADFAPVDTQA